MVKNLTIGYKCNIIADEHFYGLVYETAVQRKIPRKRDHFVANLEKQEIIMQGSNPAWIVLIGGDQDVQRACLSGRLIRSNFSEPVIAFVREDFPCELTEALQRSFDSVMVAPKQPKHLESINISKEEVLLIQLLNMDGMFSSIVAIQPGILVFQSFQEILDNGKAILNREGNWKIVPFLPETAKYERILCLLRSGMPLNTTFIQHEFADFQRELKDKHENTAVSWCDLTSYTGSTLPFVEISADLLTTHLNLGSCNIKSSKSESFWQNMVRDKLQLEPSSLNTSSRINEKSWIAVVGMACRFPNANSIEEYWQVLTSGENTSSYPPPNRNEIKSHVKANFLKCPIDEFDASFFHIAPSEAANTDVQCRLLLEVSWEAFEDAGINPEKLRSTPVGVFHGSWIQDYKDMMNLSARPDQDFFRKYIGNSFGSTAAKLSYFYGFTGLNIATESGCSSSMVAVQLACQNLLNGECPVALATGANVILHMDSKAKMVWSDDGICKTFDSLANGYGRGEGVGVLVLKRYSDALRDKDRIHGIIRGSASSQEGLSKSFGSPTVENEVKTMVNAMKAAKVSPNQVDYVEAHATGTGVGDPIEAEALVRAYTSQKERISPLLIGSVKTNIGHTESCSGIASIIKVLLALKHEAIPPHINVKTVNPKVDFSPIPGKITLEMEEWKRTPIKPRIAGVSNFGITGTDVHVIIQEPPEDKKVLKKNSLAFSSKLKTHDLHILALSAKSKPALDQLSQDFATFLNKKIEGNEFLEDLTYTTNACRPHHLFRKAVFGRNKEEILVQLQEQKSPQEESIKELTVAFIFPDTFRKEDNYIQTYASLYSKFPVFKIQMDICDNICQKLTRFSPSSYLTATNLEELNICQKFLHICHLSVSHSLYKLWETWGVKPSYLMGVHISKDIGFSIGSVVTGEVTLEQAFKILNSSETIDSMKPFKGNLEHQQPTAELIYCNNGEKENFETLDRAIETISSNGCTTFIEIGLRNDFYKGKPSTNSSLLVEVENNTKDCNRTGLELIFSTLVDLYTAGYPIDWEGFYRHQPRRKVSLPHYPFQRKSIWFKKRETQKTSQQSIENHQHPLLGKFIEAIEGDKTVYSFENSLYPQNQAPYLLDYLFGSEMIFPCTGYLEMAIAANGSTPCIIEDFCIDRPLHLPKNSGIDFKTVVRKGNDDSSSWSVLAKAEQNITWEQYASGNVKCPQFGELQTTSLLPIQHDLLEIKKRCAEEENPLKFYTQNEKHGFSYGPKFQTMKRIHKCDSSGELLVQISIPPDALNYYGHPLLSDAMIQSYLYMKNLDLTAVKVPKSIKTIVFHRRLTPQECSSWESISFHVYCNEKEDTVCLLDSKGKIVIEMISPEIIAKTVSSILTAARIPKEPHSYQNNRQVDIYEVVWKPTTKFQTQGVFIIDTSTSFTTLPSYQSLLGSLEQSNRFTNSEKIVVKNVDRLCLMYILKAMFDMGWEPEVGRTFKLDKIAGDFKIAKHFIPAFRHYLSYLVEIGVLVKESNEDFTVRALPDDPETVNLIIKELSAQLADYGPIQALNIGGSNLAQIIKGEVKGCQLLFEQGENGVTPMDQIYETNLYYRGCVNASSHIFFEIASHLWKYPNAHENGDKNRGLRILELGGKSGMFTREALFLLIEDDIKYTYYFTETSLSLTQKAEQLFLNAEDNLVFKTLDIQKDPLQQGFPPAYFDVVVALDMLSSTKDLRITLENIRRVMKPGGNIIVGEKCHPIREMDLTFGISEEYWQFNDHDVRPGHPSISADQWLGLFDKCGFTGPSSRSFLAASNMCILVGTASHPYILPEQLRMDVKPEKRWLLLHDLDHKLGFVDRVINQMSNLDRDIISHSVLQDGCKTLTQYLSETATLEGILCVFEGNDEFASENCRSILEPLLNASKYVTKKGNGRLCVATFGLTDASEGTPVGCPSSATVLGFLRCVMLEMPSINSKLVDLDPDQSQDTMADTLVQELWMADGETEISYRNSVRYARRLVVSDLASFQDLMTIPNSVENYSIMALPQSNLIADLLFVPKTIEMGDNDVIVEVRAASLIFKDILNVMKPSDELKSISTIGIDFSGVVSSVGENNKDISVGSPVFGCSWDHSSLCRYLPVPVKNLERMPPGITFEEAASFPVAFLTAWYCLVNIAQASAGQMVLIHAASGGVGLTAIQIAKILNLKVIATAGNRKKRAFLTNLGIKHVYSSRNLEFGQKIKKLTNGEGVDIVLNCLTGPGFKEASLEITKAGGYFVEISKLDIWTEDEVKMRKPRVNYKIVDLTIINRDEIRALLPHLVTLIEEGSMKPLPFTRFTASRLIHALKFLEKAKHIGKVIISMPKFDIKIGEFKDSVFNERSTYLITGGKGAIGLAITKWMVSKGAKYIVLMGRGPPGQKALDVAEKLVEKAGAVIIFKEADVAELKQCKQVLEEIAKNPKLPPLRGVHHCAGVLSDKTLMNQDWDNFDYVLNPKVKGTYNLHILTETLPLEFFVVHSSMAATFGNFGQSNYCAANAFMEGLMAKRRWMGLQGMAVSWGQWDAGLAEDMELELFEPLTIAQGIGALENFHLENRTAVVAGFLKFEKVSTLMPLYQKTFLADLCLKNQAVCSYIEEGNCNKLKSNLFETYCKAEGEEQKHIVVRDFVKERICETLGLETNEMGDNVKFATLGLDSLLSVEYYNSLQAEMGDTQLGYIDMEEQGTVEGISNLIIRLLNGIGKYPNLSILNP